MSNVKKEVHIVGDGNIIGDRNSSQVTKITTQDTGKIISVAINNFIHEIQSSDDILELDKVKALEQAREFETTLNNKEPDLGIIQKFKKFLQEKGGKITEAGLTLLSNPTVIEMITTATKRLLN